MESEIDEVTWNLFNQIDIEDEPGNEKYEAYVYKPYRYIPQPTLPRTIPQYIDFQKYVKENCKNKIKILDRETFHQIQRPILIFFNHFRQKCAYHTKWLDRMYELALKYGNKMEFIVADMIDMDVMYPEVNPINFFCRLVRPEHESPYTYAIDKRKRIYTHNDAYKTMESLSELCENFLKGNLFPSQPLPENNENKLVKICVSLNYDELVLKSTKNIFLIINLHRYENCNREPNYENIASALRNFNLDVLYMEAEKNYVPFEYCVSGYPTLIFIPHNNKNDFIYYEGQRTEEHIVTFLRKINEEPDFLHLKIQEKKSARYSKSIQVATDFSLEFDQLPQFLEDKFKNRFTVLNRKILKKTKSLVLVIFMDFQGKCLTHHIGWLNKINEIAETAYSFEFFLADFKDIDVINSKWKPEDLIDSSQGKPKIFAIDRLKHTYEFSNFDSSASLFYFIASFQRGDFYYSQIYSRKNIEQVVKDWTASHFYILLQKTKKHIFITFYSSDDENIDKLFNLLELISNDVKELNVEVVKYDVKLNYVSLEYAQPSYPVHYFIPKDSKRGSKLYVDKDLSMHQMMSFIKNNVANLN